MSYLARDCVFMIVNEMESITLFFVKSPLAVASERALRTCSNGIAIDDAPADNVAREHAAPQRKLNPMLERIERQMVKAALDRHRGKMDDAAKALGISRKGLYLKRQRLGL